MIHDIAPPQNAERPPGYPFLNFLQSTVYVWGLLFAF